MYKEAFNKAIATHDLFNRITSNLNNLLGVSFGYMKVFKDGSYYAVIDDLDYLKKMFKTLIQAVYFVSVILQ